MAGVCQSRGLHSVVAGDLVLPLDVEPYPAGALRAGRQSAAARARRAAASRSTSSLTARDGTVVEAYWATDFSPHRLSTRIFYRIANKGRWTIENQGFNDAKTRYGLAHVPHHQGSLLAQWLLVALTLVIERLFRLRYLHRRTTPPLAPIDLLRRLRLGLVAAAPPARSPSASAASLRRLRLGLVAAAPDTS